MFINLRILSFIKILQVNYFHFFFLNFINNPSSIFFQNYLFSLEFKIFFIVRMNPFIYQEQGVQCNCFNNLNSSDSSGLLGVKNNPVNINSNVFQRGGWSTESKRQKEQGIKVKTSLRRQKAKTPSQIRHHIQNEKPFVQIKIQNARLSIQQERLNTIPRQNNLRHPKQFVNIQSPQLLIPNPPSVQTEPKRTNFWRNQIIKQNNQPIKVDFNYIQQPKMQNIPPVKNHIHINYQNPYNILVSKSPPPMLISERNERKVFHQSQPIESIQNLKSSRQSKKCSLRGSDKKDKVSIKGSSTSRHQPFRMMLKQIQSVVDQNDRHYQQQVSEVIGRGWQHNQQDSFIQYNKDQRLRTQTHATRASNIKNSSTNFSNFGFSQSQFKK